MAIDREMLAVTLITAGVIIAFIVGGKKEEKPLVLEEEDDSFSDTAWKIMTYIKNVSEEIVTRRNRWFDMFEGSDNMVFNSEHLRKADPEGWQKYRNFIGDLQGWVDEFQQLRFRLVNEEGEHDWVQGNSGMLNIPLETLTMLQRYDASLTQYNQQIINKGNSKQLVMDVTNEVYKNLSIQQQHNVKQVQNVQIVDNGQNDLADMNVDMAGDPQTSAQAMRQVINANHNAAEGVAPGAAKQPGQVNPYSTVPPGKHALPLSDMANPAKDIGGGFMPNARPSGPPGTGQQRYIKGPEAGTFLNQAELMAAQQQEGQVQASSSVGSQAFAKAKVNNQGEGMPPAPFDKEREPSQETEEVLNLVQDIQEMNQANQVAVAQGNNSNADLQPKQAGGIPGKIPAKATLTQPSTDALKVNPPPVVGPKPPGEGEKVPSVPKPAPLAGQKRNDPYMALQDALTKPAKKKKSLGVDYEKTFIEDEQADIMDYGRVTDSGGYMRRADTIEKRRDRLEEDDMTLREQQATTESWGQVLGVPEPPPLDS